MSLLASCASVRHDAWGDSFRRALFPPAGAEAHRGGHDRAGSEQDIVTSQGEPRRMLTVA